MPSIACNYEDCHCQSHIVGIRTSWPQILRILPEQNSANDNSLSSAVFIPQTVSIRIDPTLPDNNAAVIYQLVGSLRHKTKPEHWISRIGIDGSFFEYDDLKQSGRYTDLGNDLSVVEAPDRANVMFVYHLVSDEQVSVYISCERSCILFLTDHKFSHHIVPSRKSSPPSRHLPTIQTSSLMSTNYQIHLPSLLEIFSLSMKVLPFLLNLVIIFPKPAMRFNLRLRA